MAKDVVLGHPCSSDSSHVMYDDIGEAKRAENFERTVKLNACMTTVKCC